MTVAIFLSSGCEEIEALTVVDILRRAAIDIQMISVDETNQIIGSHNIKFEAEYKADEIVYDDLDGIILPGGMPGTKHLDASDTVQRVIADFHNKGKLLAAICAAPSVLGKAGILKGKRASCYPGFEEQLHEAMVTQDAVVVDGNIITSRGMGTAIPFALEIVRYFLGDAKAQELAESIMYQ